MIKIKKYTIILIAILVLSSTQIINACDDCDENCSDVHAGTVNRDKTWAHYDRVDGSTSTYITLTATGGYDTDWVDGTCQGNYIYLGDTNWYPSSGTCYPTRGSSTSWTPSAAGYFTVQADFRDYSYPCNEDGDMTDGYEVNAFEVAVDMTMIDNADGGNGTVQKTVWEYEDPCSVTWEDLPCYKSAYYWEGDCNNTAVGNGDSDNVHIEFTYRASDDTANLDGGYIGADLRTASSCNLHVNVEDADQYDGSTSINLGVSTSTPVGFSVGTTATFGSDCAEGMATAAWGYSSTDGLGSSQSPSVNCLKKKSEGESDPILHSLLCTYLESNTLPLSVDFQSHPYNSPKSYDTGLVSIPKTINGVVQAEWTGYADAGTGGSGSGKYGYGSVQVWDVFAGIADVYFIP